MHPKKRLLRILRSTNPQLGGVVEAVRVQAPYLNKMGIEVEVVTCDSPDEPWLNQQENVTPLGPSKLNYGFTNRLKPWLRSNAGRFDAIIIEGLWQYHGLAAWSVFAGLDVPYFVITHGMLDPWFKSRYPLKHLKKWLYWPWAEYRILRDAWKVIYTCTEEMEQAHQSFWLYKANDAISPLGIEDKGHETAALADHFYEHHPHLRNKKLLLFMSRIHEKKGCDLLLSAFAKLVKEHPEYHLVMAGPDLTGITKSLKNQASRLGISEFITWTGMLSGDLKWSVLHAADIFCLPSHHENFGIVVAEALSCGTPVLISNKVNIWPDINEYSCGLVCKDTEESVSTFLEQWHSLIPDQKELMRSNARKCFEECYRVEIAVEKLISTLGLA